MQSNSDAEAVHIRQTPFFGGKFTHCIESFPHDDILAEGGLKNVMLTKLQWSVGTYIDTLGFTMSNGAASPKYGCRAFTN